MKKTNYLKLAKVLMMLPMLVFLVNCSKSSKNEGHRGYGHQQYYMANGQCYGPGNMPVQMHLCQNSGIGQPGFPGGGGYGQVCDGIYWYPHQQYGGQMGQVMCSAQTRNCSGYTVFRDQYGQQPVNCQ